MTLTRSVSGRIIVVGGYADMGWRKMSNDEFHEAAVKGLRAMHKRGEVSDDDMADQERWWARGGHLDGEDGETTTWIGS